MRDITVAIDSIALIDLGLSPERSDHIRDLVKRELQQLLSQKEFSADVRGGEISLLRLPSIDLDKPLNERGLAQGIARSIATAVQGAGRQDRK
jgi:hypothetical protein